MTSQENEETQINYHRHQALSKCQSILINAYRYKFLSITKQGKAINDFDRNNSEANIKSVHSQFNIRKRSISGLPNEHRPIAKLIAVNGRGCKYFATNNVSTILNDKKAGSNFIKAMHFQLKLPRIRCRHTEETTPHVFKKKVTPLKSSPPDYLKKIKIRGVSMANIKKQKSYYSLSKCSKKQETNELIVSEIKSKMNYTEKENIKLLPEIKMPLIKPTLCHSKSIYSYSEDLIF